MLHRIFFILVNLCTLYAASYPEMEREYKPIDLILYKLQRTQYVLDQDILAVTPTDFREALQQISPKDDRYPCLLHVLIYRRMQSLYVDIIRDRAFAEQPTAWDLLNFGLLCNLKNDNQNYEQYIRQAADLNLPRAQYLLAMIWDTKAGNNKHYNMPAAMEAARIYLAAAGNGFAEAQFKLGYFYEYGRGVEKNYETAAAWYNRAAEQGHPSAQYQLAKLYQHGLGVPCDLYTAERLYRSSIAGGNQDAWQALEKLHKTECAIL